MEQVTRRPTTAVHVRAFEGEAVHERPDRVVAEEPMEIRGQAPRSEAEPVAVTMRTPGHDFDLAVGFLLTEGIVAAAADVESVAYCPEGDGVQHFNVVTVRTRRSPDLARARRAFAVSASCGVCGQGTLADAEGWWRPVGPGPVGSTPVLSL